MIDQLRTLINLSDHHLIRKIYIPCREIKNDYVWSQNRDGCYTVKSGCWLAKKRLNDDEEGAPPLASTPDIAAAIWKLDIAPKLKHFLWQLTSKAIAMADNLRHRNIMVNRYYSRCCVEEKAINHVFFTCTQAKSVWRLGGVPTHLLCDHTTTLAMKLRFLLSIHDNNQMTRLTRLLPFWILWRLWKSRNKLLFNRTNIDATETIQRALVDTKEWIHSSSVSPDQIVMEQKFTGTNTHANGWKRPRRGWVKCNYDVSHHEGNIDSGMGWIIRNDNGFFMDCGMGKYQGRMTIEEAECFALIWALQSTWSLGYRMVEFEGGNMNINRLLNDKGTNHRLLHYIADIRKWQRMFSSANFSFKSRNSNRCADLLVRKTIICNTQ